MVESKEDINQVKGIIDSDDSQDAIADRQWIEDVKISPMGIHFPESLGADKQLKFF